MQSKKYVLNFVKKYVSEKKKVNVLQLLLLSMPVYAWICLNKQGFEYVRVRNMPQKNT